MKLVIISDSHGNIANLKLVLGFAKKIKAGAIIHCGDWDNIKAVEVVKSAKIRLYAVSGNADIDPKFKEMFKSQLIINLEGRKIGVVHNFKDFSDKTKSLDDIFCGHRHFKMEKVIDGVKVVAPGALHSVEPSFAVYDTETNAVEFFDL